MQNNFVEQNALSTNLQLSSELPFPKMEENRIDTNVKKGNHWHLETGTNRNLQYNSKKICEGNETDYHADKKITK